ncbi:helix-turn-helix domain-containing protein [Kitasatospora sp. NPDC002040]|uniref:helix-turn-helix domain-containing protein n=1 Tax=Kitasatospora sp. NPDC002040 TaxID=3154661 RepID=UPI00333168D7
MKQERSKRTFERVLDAAAELFATHGYAHTTIADVAARIGMTKGALYGHFASKDDLGEAMNRHGAQAWEAIRDDSGAESGGVVLDPLGAVTLRLGRELAADIRLRAAYRLAADALLSGEPAAAAAGKWLPPDANLLLEIQGHLNELVRLAQRSGDITRSYSAADITEMLLAFVAAVRSATLKSSGIDPVAWMETVWRMTWGALAEGEGRSAEASGDVVR